MPRSSHTDIRHASSPTDISHASYLKIKALKTYKGDWKKPWPFLPKANTQLYILYCTLFMLSYAHQLCHWFMTIPFLFKHQKITSSCMYTWHANQTQKALPPEQWDWKFGTVFFTWSLKLRSPNNFNEDETTTNPTHKSNLSFTFSNCWLFSVAHYKR